MADAYSGPATEADVEFDSFRPSLVQMALVTSQSVVYGFAGCLGCSCQLPGSLLRQPEPNVIPS